MRLGDVSVSLAVKDLAASRSARAESEAVKAAMAPRLLSLVVALVVLASAWATAASAQALPIGAKSSGLF